MKLQAKDLRVGNLIENIHDQLITVTGFYIRGFEEKKGLIENYRPIPLTEEWLVKLGFEITYDEDKCKLFCIKNKHIGTLDVIKIQVDDEIIAYVNDIRVINIDYVHQAQNIVFALTGEELTIKE